MKRKIYLFIAIIALVALVWGVKSFAASATDEAVLGNDRWSVQSDGDLSPNTDVAYDIGSSSYRVDVGYMRTVNATTANVTNLRLSGVFTAPLYTVATLPAAATYPGAIAIITDGASATDCTTGADANAVLCYSTGSAWAHPN